MLKQLLLRLYFQILDPGINQPWYPDLPEHWQRCPGCRPDRQTSAPRTSATACGASGHRPPYLHQSINRTFTNINVMGKCFGTGFIDSGSGSSLLGWIPIWIRIQGFEDPKLKKLTADKIFLIFFKKKLPHSHPLPIFWRLASAGLPPPPPPNRISSIKLSGP